MNGVPTGRHEGDQGRVLRYVHSLGEVGRQLIQRFQRRPRARWTWLSAGERWGMRLYVVGLLTIAVSFVLFEMVMAVSPTAGPLSPAVADRWVAVIAGVMELRFVGLLLLFAGMMIGVVGRCRAVRRVRAARFALCPGCGYSLFQIRRVSRCPECGYRFDPKGVVRTWGRVLPRFSLPFGQRLWSRRYAD
jgi:hypothetical protein